MWKLNFEHLFGDETMTRITRATRHQVHSTLSARHCKMGHIKYEYILLRYIQFNVETITLWLSLSTNEKGYEARMREVQWKNKKKKWRTDENTTFTWLYEKWIWNDNICVCTVYFVDMSIYKMTYDYYCISTPLTHSKSLFTIIYFMVVSSCLYSNL